jgi:hypothetical protein
MGAGAAGRATAAETIATRACAAAARAGIGGGSGAAGALVRIAGKNAVSALRLWVLIEWSALLYNFGSPQESDGARILGGFPENDEFGFGCCHPLSALTSIPAVRWQYAARIPEGPVVSFAVPRGDRHASELSVHDFDRLAAQLGERITAIEIKAR